jgi:hypothetical protein
MLTSLGVYPQIRGRKDGEKNGKLTEIDRTIAVLHSYSCLDRSLEKNDWLRARIA